MVTGKSLFFCKLHIFAENLNDRSIGYFLFLLSGSSWKKYPLKANLQIFIFPHIWKRIWFLQTILCKKEKAKEGSVIHRPHRRRYKKISIFLLSERLYGAFILYSNSLAFLLSSHIQIWFARIFVYSGQDVELSRSFKQYLNLCNAYKC